MTREIEAGGHGVGAAVVERAPRAGAGVEFGGGEGAAGRWFVIRTRSRQEKALSLDLGARGIDHFLPLSRVVRYHGRRKAVVMEPLFPGYLFLRGELDQAYAAERTGRVAQVLVAPDQRKLCEELRNIGLAVARGAELAACERIECGVLVEVSAGPLRGIRGTVEAVVRDDRLVLNVELIAKAAQLEIDRTLLRRVQ